MDKRLRRSIEGSVARAVHLPPQLQGVSGRQIGALCRQIVQFGMFCFRFNCSPIRACLFNKLVLDPVLGGRPPAFKGVVGTNLGTNVGSMLAPCSPFLYGLCIASGITGVDAQVSCFSMIEEQFPPKKGAAFSRLGTEANPQVQTGCSLCSEKCSSCDCRQYK